jgi:hypothetical protein
MQFIADENVSHRVVERLRADGYDVTLVVGEVLWNARHGRSQIGGS